jgi:hypothetical protein
MKASLIASISTRLLVARLGVRTRLPIDSALLLLFLERTVKGIRLYLFCCGIFGMFWKALAARGNNHSVQIEGLRSYNELRAAHEELKSRGIPINATTDHGVAKGVYFPDPDGNELEFYVDGDPEIYKNWPNPAPQSLISRKTTRDFQPPKCARFASDSRASTASGLRNLRVGASLAAKDARSQNLVVDFLEGAPAPRSAGIV